MVTFVASAHTGQAQNLFMRSEHPWGAFCYTNYEQIIRLVDGKENQQFDKGLLPQWRSGNLHVSEVLSLAEVKASIREQESLHTSLTGDRP
jgi:hypothetical protein